LDGNGQLLAEKKKVMGSWTEYFQGKEMGSIKHRIWYGRSWF